MRNIILASSSPRRIEMMKEHGYTPIIMPANIDENLPRNINPNDGVMLLALKKALYVESQLPDDNNGDIIVAADTLIYKNEIMGKPIDRNDAFSMLSKIKNTSHYVTTGVAIIVAGYNYKKVFFDETEVFVKNYSDVEINAYLDTDEPYDKAGAYAIQGIFSKYIDHYNGSYNTVVGFPIDKVIDEINLATNVLG